MGASDLRLSDMESPVMSISGKLAVPPDHRDKCALLQNGVLLVAQSYAKDLAVLAYVELLKRNGIRFETKLVSVNEVQSRYATASSAQRTKGPDGTHRQLQVKALIAEAAKRRVSDMHFRNRLQSTELWMRIDGELVKTDEFKADDGREICSTIYQSMCDVADETYKPGKSQDARLKREFVNDLGLYGARVATRPLEYGNVFVLRLLSHRENETLEGLGYQPAQIELIRRMTQRTTGINVFSGPTGSGKSTSLKVLLTSLMQAFRFGIHLLTIENPPEAPIPGAVQTPLLDEWGQAIRNAMRLDPDVMMVGEMRDKDSASMAIDAAMTGHGVWTTLHANNAVQILDRLIEMGVNPARVTDASLMTGLINQSLVARNCPQCARPFERCKRELAPDLIERVERFCTPGTVKLKGRDRACKHCGGVGYVGRIVAAECFIPNQKLMNLYRTDGTAGVRAEWVAKYGGITKCAALINLVNGGVVDPSMAERKVCMLSEDELTLA